MRRSDDDAWAVFTRYPVPPEPGTGSIWAVRVDARMQPVGMLVSLIGHGIDPRAIRVGERVPIFYAIRGSSMALTASYTPVLTTSHPLLMAPYHTGMHRYRLLCGRDDGETAGFAIDQSELAAHLVRPRHGPTGTVHDDRGGNGAPEAGTPPRISAVHLSKARPPIPLRSRTGFDGRTIIPNRSPAVARHLPPATSRPLHDAKIAAYLPSAAAHLRHGHQPQTIENIEYFLRIHKKFNLHANSGYTIVTNAPPKLCATTSSHTPQELPFSATRGTDPWKRFKLSRVL